MPMFSDEIGTLVADLARRRGARQEANADARSRETLLNYVQAPLFAQGQEDPSQQETAAATATSPMLTGGQFGFTPAPGATVTPMLTGLQPIIDDPGSASQGGSKSERGVTGAGRTQAEAILFPMLTKAENRDLSRKTAELDQLVRARPALVSRMYGGEDAAKPIDSRIKELQTEIDKGQQSNERLQTNQMLTGQRLVSSYSTSESQQASLAAKRDMADARDRTRTAIAAGRLEFDNKKLLVNSTLHGMDQVVRLYGIKSGYLSSPAALQRAVMTGTLDQELQQAGMDENTIGKTVGGIRRGTLLVQSKDPADVVKGSQVLMDAQMDLERLLGTGPDPEPDKWGNLYNSIAPEGMQVQALTPEKAAEIKAANENLRTTENTQLGTLAPGEKPPEFVFSNGSKYVRVSGSTSSTNPAPRTSKIAPAAAAPKAGWYKDADGVMRKH